MLRMSQYVSRSRTPGCRCHDIPATAGASGSTGRSSGASTRAPGLGSDAAIVQGLIALLIRVYSQRTADEILSTDAQFLAEIGLDSHLSATRKTGLASMMSAIKASAG